MTGRLASITPMAEELTMNCLNPTTRGSSSITMEPCTVNKESMLLHQEPAMVTQEVHSSGQSPKEEKRVM